jgi:hypothetical protein
MSDLNSQLRQAADAAASQARPMPVTDVIKRGDRRRQHVITQRSIGGLSAVAIVAAFILTGTHSSPPAAASAGAAAHGLTVTEQTASAAGKITIVMNYADEKHGKLKLSSLKYSLHAKSFVKDPALEVSFQFAGGGKGPTAVGFVSSLKPGNGHDFAGTLSAKDLNPLPKGERSGLQVLVSLQGKVSHKNAAAPVLQEGVVLS